MPPLRSIPRWRIAVVTITLLAAVGMTVALSAAPIAAVQTTDDPGEEYPDDPPIEEIAEYPYDLGDVTETGEVTFDDARAIYDVAMGQPPAVDQFTPFLADIDRDGTISRDDAILASHIVVNGYSSQVRAEVDTTTVEDEGVLAIDVVNDGEIGAVEWVEYTIVDATGQGADRRQVAVELAPADSDAHVERLTNDVSALPAGTYEVVVETPDGTTYDRFVIENDVSTRELAELPYDLGDVTMTGAVNAEDAELIAEYAQAGPPTDAVRAELADLTRSGDITATDRALATELAMGADHDSDLALDIEPQARNPGIDPYTVDVIVENDGRLGAVEVVNVTLEGPVDYAEDFAVDVGSALTDDDAAVEPVSLGPLPAGTYRLTVEAGDAHITEEFGVGMRLHSAH